MTTLKELAQRHGVKETSLRIWLKEETQIRPDMKVVKGRLRAEFDRKAVTAVAVFLGGRHKKLGRPLKPTAKKKGK